MNQFVQKFCIIFIVLLLASDVTALERKNQSIDTDFKNNIMIAFETEKIIEDNSVNYNIQTTLKPKSTKKAILYSALVPGWGEYYAGRKNKAKYFFAAEAITWIAYFSFRTYGNWRKDDMIRMAAEKASANLEGKDDFFQDMVGFYENLYEYNSLGRITDSNRPYYYDTSDYYWNWQTTEDRNKYRDLKNSFRSAFKNSETVIGLAILNRLISIIDAVRDVKNYNRQINDPFSKPTNSVILKINPFSETNQITLKWYPSL